MFPGKDRIDLLASQVLTNVKSTAVKTNWNGECGT